MHDLPRAIERIGHMLQTLGRREYFAFYNHQGIKIAIRNIFTDCQATMHISTQEIVIQFTPEVIHHTQDINIVSTIKIHIYLYGFGRTCRNLFLVGVILPDELVAIKFVWQSRRQH